MKTLLLILLLGACSFLPVRQPPPTAAPVVDDEVVEEVDAETPEKPRRKKPVRRTPASAVPKDAPADLLPPCDASSADKNTEVLLKMDCIIETGDTPPK